jgi:hypothetical protein
VVTVGADLWSKDSFSRPGLEAFEQRHSAKASWFKIDSLTGGGDSEYFAISSPGKRAFLFRRHLLSYNDVLTVVTMFLLLCCLNIY